MGPQQGQRTRDAHVDAIDLTLSSPEPEIKPQPQVDAHLQHKQLSTRYRQEPGSSSRSAHSGNDYSQQQDPARNGNVPQQQPRQVHPQHVRQIIDTSSPRALRQVVLQLCKTSPALSGAIARGLAPHSAYAQALIRGQPAKSQVPTAQRIKFEHGSHSQDAFERTEKRPGPSNSAQNSVSRPHTHRPPVASEDRDGLRVPSSQTASRVKREYRASSTDSDDSTNIVDFPGIERNVLVHEPHTRTSAVASSRNPVTTHLSATRAVHRPTQNRALDSKSRLCLQCGEMFKEGEINCYYHPDREMPTGTRDVPKYMCCGKSPGEPGCVFGRHTSERAGTLANSNRILPPPFGGAQQMKRPRFL